MLATRFVLRSAFTCACDLAAPEGAGLLLVSLSAAVGDAPAPRCPNRPADVRAVQEALNHFAPADGGPSPALVVDGVCNAPTRRAIRAFQRRWATCGLAGGTERDGVIDVDGPTLARLREGPAGPTSAGVGDGAGASGAARARAVRPRVLELIASARAVLSVAAARYKRVPLAGDVANLARADAAVAKAERHFHAGQTRDPAARLARVDGVFQLMQTALALSADGVVAAAAPPADDPHALASAWAGGFHTGATPCGGGSAAFQHGAAAGRMDAIRLYPAAAGLDGDALAYALVHALAHHVAPTSAPIVDLAAWHRAPDAYAALGPAEALRNADSYAQFAFDAAGRGGFDPRRGGRGGEDGRRYAREGPGEEEPATEEGDEAGGVEVAGV